MKLVLLATTAIALAACSPTQNKQVVDGLFVNGGFTSIVGGEPATDQDSFSKSTVAVIDGLQGGVCTGTLIAKNVVVTAAHCVQNGTRSLYIGFGLDLVGSQKIAAQESKFHDRYTVAMTELEAILQTIQEATVPGPERNAKVIAALDDYKNWGDVALIKFKGEAPAGYVPAEILEDGRYLQNGANILLAGYGITKPYSEQVPGEEEESVLRKVETKLHNAVYSETEVTFDQTAGKGACHGDSGGPAFVKVGDKYKLFGVTSRGVADPDDSCRQYSGYSYLPAFTQWKNDILAAWEKADQPAPEATPKVDEASSQAAR